MSLIREIEDMNVLNHRPLCWRDISYSRRLPFAAWSTVSTSDAAGYSFSAVDNDSLTI